MAGAPQATFCPSCGLRLQGAAASTRFCARCGSDLETLREFIKSDPKGGVAVEEPLGPLHPGVDAVSQGVITPGTELGGCVVEEQLGEGGMGTVYRCRHASSGETVVLKVLHPSLAGDKALRTRFMREARAAAAIGHPNVVKVLDIGEDRGVRFMMLEYVQGRGLDVVVDEGGPLPVPEAVRIAAEMLAGLEATHAAGIVHRDIKPSNVIVNGRGGVRIVDFGLAYDEHAANQQRLTRTGLVIGTPEYMAPEQCRGSTTVTRSTDIYSAAAVLYCLLAGRPPFQEEGTWPLLLRHMNDPPPPLRDHCPSAPPALEAAVMRALEKKPEDRFESVAAFREAILPFAGPVPVAVDALEPVSDVAAPLSASERAEDTARVAPPNPEDTDQIAVRRAQPGELQPPFPDDESSTDVVFKLRDPEARPLIERAIPVIKQAGPTLRRVVDRQDVAVKVAVLAAATAIVGIVVGLLIPRGPTASDALGAVARARGLHASGETDKAMAVLEEWLARLPEDATLLAERDRLRAETAYLRAIADGDVAMTARDFEAAIGHFERARAAKPTLDVGRRIEVASRAAAGRDAERRAAALLAKARALLTAGDADAALEAAREARALDDTAEAQRLHDDLMHDVLIRRGDAALGADEVETALRLFAGALHHRETPEALTRMRRAFERLSASQLESRVRGDMEEVERLLRQRRMIEAADKAREVELLAVFASRRLRAEVRVLSNKSRAAAEDEHEYREVMSAVTDARRRKPPTVETARAALGLTRAYLKRRKDGAYRTEVEQSRVAMEAFIARIGGSATAPPVAELDPEALARREAGLRMLEMARRHEEDREIDAAIDKVATYRSNFAENDDDRALASAWIERLQALALALDEIPADFVLVRASDEAPTGVATFYACEHEVTRTDYELFCKATGRPRPPSWGASSFGKGQLPVEEISLDDALAYTEWLTSEAKRVIFRLPTEAEWDWAARPPAGKRWPWGEGLKPDHANFSGQAEAVKSRRTGRTDAGLYDLIGNVAEWVLADDGPVVKGGSYLLADPEDARPGRRERADPDLRVLGVGFRVVAQVKGG